jgi:N6-L-threonylcarbamoyladenine synthase
MVLGIETSCDDTAAAVVRGGRLASSVVSSQDVHGPYGGVVPELASRDHQRLIVPVVRRALAEAGVAESAVDAVAVTYGPGLAGSLLVGLSFAKAFAWARSVPLVGVNHLEGHLFSLFVEEPHPPLPFLCLVVSGGHTQVVEVRGDFAVRTLSRTRDDAAGEAFDKVGKLLGLPYPGGPHVDRLAASGDPRFADFPRTALADSGFSFSGIKTAVLYHLNAVPEREREAYLEAHLADLCASFQAAVVDMLADGVERAVRSTGIRDVGVAGGVSANTALRASLGRLAERLGLMLHVTDPRWSTDNAAMIAVAGHHKLAAGRTSDLSLTAEPALAL